MSRSLLWYAPWLALLPLSCGGLPTSFEHVTHPLRLAEIQLPDGLTERYVLEVNDPGSGIAVVVETQRLEQHASLGLEVQEITRSFAKDRNLRPYSGVWITKVEPAGPADMLGLRPGDVIVAIGDLEVYDLDGCEHAMRRVAPGQIARLRVRKQGATDTVDLSLTSTDKRREFVERRAVALAAAGLDDEHSGMALATVPPALAKKLYGVDGPCVLIASTELASPAELSGLQPGDRLVAIDGRTVQDATQARRMIAYRAKERDRVQLTVEHLASGSIGTVEVLLDDYEDDHEIKIPLIFRFEDRYATTDWSLGPLGWLMDYESQYAYQGGVPEGRERYRKKKKFAMLLDLFCHTWYPDERGGSETRLLWLIKFEF